MQQLGTIMAIFVGWIIPPPLHSGGFDNTADAGMIQHAVSQFNGNPLSKSQNVLHHGTAIHTSGFSGLRLTLTIRVSVGRFAGTASSLRAPARVNRYACDPWAYV